MERALLGTAVLLIGDGGYGRRRCAPVQRLVLAIGPAVGRGALGEGGRLAQRDGPSRRGVGASSSKRLGGSAARWRRNPTRAGRRKAGRREMPSGRAGDGVNFS